MKLFFSRKYISSENTVVQQFGVDHKDNELINLVMKNAAKTWLRRKQWTRMPPKELPAEKISLKVNAFGSKLNLMDDPAWYNEQPT